MNENDEKIIRHIARYRVGLRPIFLKLIFDGNESALGNSIARLVKAGRIETRQGFFLTRVKAVDAGAPTRQALGAQLIADWKRAAEREAAERVLQRTVIDRYRFEEQP